MHASYLPKRFEEWTHYQVILKMLTSFSNHTCTGPSMLLQTMNIFLLGVAWTLFASTPTSAALTWAECALKIQGTPILSGSFTCFGGTVSAALHRSIPLKSGSFQVDGIKLESRSCQREGCLITLCKDSRAVIAATVSNVTVPGHGVPSVLCLAGRASIRLSRPIFKGNNASGVYAAQDSTARIEDGIFMDGHVQSGAGFIARGNSTVEVYRSEFVNNTSIGW